MKKETGITLIRLCVIVAVIIFITVTSFFVLKDSYEKSELNRYIAKMEAIQEKVNFVRNEYKLWENYNPNETGNFYSYLQELGYVNANAAINNYISDFNNIIAELNLNTYENWDLNTDTILANYCYFSSDDLEIFFGLKDMDLNVIINFYSGNIISREGMKDGDKIIHRQYDSEFGNDIVITAIYNNEAVPKFEIIENLGIEQKVKVALDLSEAEILEVYYQKDDETTSLKKCSTLKNYKYVPEENAVYFNIDVSGKYTFIIEDKNFVQYPKIEYEFKLCNPPELLEGMMGVYWDENNVEKQIVSNYDSNWYNYSTQNLIMANAKTEDGNYWVWVPRFKYKETDEIVDIDYINGLSNISTSNVSKKDYKIHQAFSEDMAGFWISKFQANIENDEINFKPGKTLTVMSKSNAQKFINGIRNRFYKIDMLDEKKMDATIKLSNASGIEILNDLIHYAGGGPGEENFKENFKYSSSGNASGVYDLYTSETEITKNSLGYENGRFRTIIEK